MRRAARATVLLVLAVAGAGCASDPPRDTSDAWIWTRPGDDARAPVPERFRWAREDAPFELRIGSWNMHYLGPSDETEEETRSPDALADYVLGSGVSLLALQEIGASPGLPPRRNATLDAVFGEVRARGRGDWTYELVPSHRGTDELTGVAWDRREVELLEPPRPVGVASGRTVPLPTDVELPLAGNLQLPVPVVWDRHPWAFHFTTGLGTTDLVVVSVHMRADVDDLLFGDPLDLRTHEASLLAAEVDALRRHFRDRDVVLVGDFNVVASSKALDELFGREGLVDANADDLPTYVDAGTALDRAFVPAEQREFAGPGDFFRVGVRGLTPAEFSERYSDHRMVVTRLRIRADDD